MEAFFGGDVFHAENGHNLTEPGASGDGAARLRSFSREEAEASNISRRCKPNPDMKVITNLTAHETDAPFNDTSGLIIGSIDTNTPGFPRRLVLCSSGLICRHGDAAVAIPAEELWKLAEGFEPALKPTAVSTSADQKEQPNPALKPWFGRTSPPAPHS